VETALRMVWKGFAPASLAVSTVGITVTRAITPKLIPLDSLFIFCYLFAVK
jgi:ABC-type enterochelin transport system permease subunit